MLQGNLRQVLSRNDEVHDYFAADKSAQQPCYALLNMQCSERTVLGVEGGGDIIKRDEQSPGAANDLELTELLLGDEIRRIVLTITFPRDELVAKPRLFQ